MPYADFSFEQWNDLSEGAARGMAQGIADQHDLTVVGLKNTVYGGAVAPGGALRP
ncbi:hypothetical protein [Micromonospora sp. C95]|uniref:hypothetical protein n=1 Tax=Micromonospora sp. C95 TaxID=2824882 RepID=UPI002657545F|nr:hypothetical protein [Micromonospora sp. C95]